MTVSLLRFLPFRQSLRLLVTAVSLLLSSYLQADTTERTVHVSMRDIPPFVEVQKDRYTGSFSLVVLNANTRTESWAQHGIFPAFSKRFFGGWAR